MAEISRTFIIIKPDAVQRGLISEVLARLERRGLKFVALKLMRIDRALAEKHYAEHKGKPFYDGLVAFITSSPVVVGVVEGPNAAQTVRDTVGLTDPLKAAPGTLRFDFALDTGRNIIHASQPADAEQEIANFFGPDDILSYTRAIDPWVIEG